MGLGDWFKSPGEKAASPDREQIAGIYLEGEGIEIGALQFPLKVPPAARVRYVDRMAAAELRRQYPELEKAELTPVDIIDDGQRLAKIADGAQDFVIANHFLEHCEDPIRAIENFLRVLKPGGVIYLAVPDKRFTFDEDRPVTTFDHLLADYREGPQRSRRDHYEQWVRDVHKVEDDAWAEDRIRHFMETDYSIHFHVWTQAELMEMLAALKRELSFAFDVELFVKSGDECIVILRKHE